MQKREDKKRKNTTNKQSLPSKTQNKQSLPSHFFIFFLKSSQILGFNPTLDVFKEAKI